jgi:hypothetical protein
LEIILIARKKKLSFDNAVDLEGFSANDLLQNKSNGSNK